MAVGISYRVLLSTTFGLDFIGSIPGLSCEISVRSCGILCDACPLRFNPRSVLRDLGEVLWDLV